MNIHSRNKFHAVRTEVDGISFASKAEARRYSELRLLERLGDIRNLQLQPRFPLKINGVAVGTYVADFAYAKDGQRVIEDVKGVRTPVYMLKKKLVRALYGVEIQEVG